MSFAVTFRPEAEKDLLEAFRWYEEQSRGLGSELFQSVEVCIANIQSNPEAYPIIYKTIHRALLRRFPFGIFYIIEGETIIVLACFHFRRNPKHWQRRM